MRLRSIGYVQLGMRRLTVAVSKPAVPVLSLQAQRPKDRPTFAQLSTALGQLSVPESGQPQPAPSPGMASFLFLARAPFAFAVALIPLHQIPRPLRGRKYSERASEGEAGVG